MFKGPMTAIVTPFKNNEIDEEALRALVNFQIENGIMGIIPCGTTGESATLSYEEHERVIKIVIEEVNKRVPVIAGTGSNSTREAIELTKSAKEMGADAALLITPYYNKPTQEGLYQHYKKVAEEVNIPIIMYNVPGRTAVNMLPETVAKLAKIPNIIGIKDATGSINVLTEMIQLTEGEEFYFLSGDDFIYYPFLCVGGHGVISVVANIAPKLMRDVYDAVQNNDHEKAKMLHHKVFRLAKAMFLQTNPIPVKKALYLMGKIEDEIRLPLVSMSGEPLEALKKILTSEGII